MDLNLTKNGFWCCNFKNHTLNLQSASLRYYLHQFWDKTDKLEFFGPNLRQKEFWFGIFENPSLDSESATFRYCVHQFSDNANNFELFGAKFAQKCILRSKYQKSKSRFLSLRYYVNHFSGKTDNFEFVSLNLSKKMDFGGGYNKNLSLGSESPHLRYYVHQFSDKKDNFEFLHLNLTKNGFSVGISKIEVWIWNQQPSYTVCTNFQTTWTTLNFSAKISPKIDFGLKISKI